MVFMVYIELSSRIFEELFEGIHYNIFGILDELFDRIFDQICKGINQIKWNENEIYNENELIVIKRDKIENRIKLSREQTQCL